MPFTEHLRELRNRLIVSLATVGGIAVVLFWPSQFVIRWMMREYFRGIELHAFGPADVIFTEFKFSVIGGIVIGLPVLLQQLWLFVVPAIHPRTRRMVYAFILPSILLAALGLAFAHFVVIPRVVSRVAAHHRCGCDAHFRRRRHVELRHGPARAFCDYFSNADRARRHGASRDRECELVDALSPSRDLRLFRRRGHRRARRKSAHHGLAGLADVRTLRDFNLGDSPSRTPVVQFGNPSKRSGRQEQALR